jgi:ribonuclease P protein component
MLPANRRLTTEFFEETIAGRSFHSPLVSIKAIKKSATKTRFAVAPAKKNFKTAVSRNNARRRVYAAVSSLLSRIADGFFVVILVKPEALKLKQPELRSVIANILDKAGIMKKAGSGVE